MKYTHIRLTPRASSMLCRIITRLERDGYNAIPAKYWKNLKEARYPYSEANVVTVALAILEDKINQ